MNKIFFCLLSYFALASAFSQDWLDFKTKFGKVYSSDKEELERYAIFKDNVAMAKDMDAASKYTSYGITKFMDLTTKEFKETILMKENVPIFPENSVAPQIMGGLRGLPSTFDWRNKSGVVSPVKNQGQCGSCWDFSATETIESVCAIAGYGLQKLSEEQILDCDTTADGCDGGWPYWAYEYIISAGGIETEAEYPYTAEQGSCSTQKSKFVDCKPSSWKYVIKNENENTMQTYLYDNSPLSVCVDAETWQTYTGGVVMGSTCGTSIDHCVQVTGWTQQQGMEVWTVRNSWGSSWGLDGYLYVQKGVDACAIAQVVTVPCVASKTNPGTTQC